MSDSKYTTPASKGASRNNDSAVSKRSSTPSSASTSRSLMHSGRIVRSSITIIPEKASPINATPTDFKRVKISPQTKTSMTSNANYDNRLKLLTDTKQQKAPSPEEKRVALSVMANMFDDENEKDHHVENPTVSSVPSPAAIYSSRSSLSNSGNRTSTVVTPSTQEATNYSLMFSDSSILEEDDDLKDHFMDVGNTVQGSPEIELPPESENPWIALLNAAVDKAKLESANIPPPIIPNQYQVPKYSVSSAANATNGVDTGVFSSLVATLSQNRQKSLISAPSIATTAPLYKEIQIVTPRPSSSMPSSLAVTAGSSSIDKLPPSSISALRTPVPHHLSHIAHNAISPSFPTRNAVSSISQIVPDMSIPTWSPTTCCSTELDSSLQPYLDFLENLDREFSSASDTVVNPAGKDNLKRLWQRYMLLPTEKLQEKVFEQHQTMIDLGVFDQVLSLDDKTSTKN